MTSIEVCRGSYWYGRHAGPFFEASKQSDDRIDIDYRVYVPEHGSRQIRADKHDGQWEFLMEIPRPGDNLVLPEAFAWRHNQTSRAGASDHLPDGYILVQLSTNTAVARLSRAGSLLSGDIEIEFLGGGGSYPGIWKLTALVVGIFGTSDNRGGWSRRRRHHGRNRAHTL